jgi:hypothetical protein
VSERSEGREIKGEKDGESSRNERDAEGDEVKEEENDDGREGQRVVKDGK